jgi:hypothetical protein
LGISWEASKDKQRICPDFSVPKSLTMRISFDISRPRSRPEYAKNPWSCISFKRLLLACSALAISAVGRPAYAQFTDPRNYQNSPVGVNQVELAYVYVHANSSIDAAIVIPEATLNLNQGTISYMRYFSFLRRMAWVSPNIPIAGLNGSISGTNVSGATAGAGDSSFEAAVLLMGGPALSVSEFESFRPRMTMGLSLSVTAPTGSYQSDKILNLGADRWSFKPEFAVSYPFGDQQKWALDCYANSYFYTDNSSYRGVQVLRQQSLPGFEGHVSYSFLENLVGSLDTRYSFRGNTSVNDENQNNAQRNFILGGEAIFSLNERNSLRLVLAKALVHQNGPSIAGISVKYDYSWGNGYR